MESLDSLQWQTSKLQELTSLELYDIVKLRIDVFVVEQKCPYPELDHVDRDCYHMFARNNDKIIAYLRAYQKKSLAKNTGQTAHLGRIVVLPEYRGKHLGTELVKQGIKLCKEQWNVRMIKISAQYRLISFYLQLGFYTMGDQYLEDDIPHIEMHYQVSRLDQNV